MNGFFAPLLVVLLMPPAALHAQSLAGLAQQAADDRAAKASGADTPPAKVYTDKDPPASPPPAPAKVAKPIAAVAPAKTTTIVNAKGVKNEAYWKDRMRALQSTLADARAQLRTSTRVHDEVAISGRGALGYSKLVDAAAEMAPLDRFGRQRQAGDRRAGSRRAAGQGPARVAAHPVTRRRSVFNSAHLPRRAGRIIAGRVF